MSIFFLLHHNVGITLVEGMNEDGSIDPENITIKFNNRHFNQKLAEWFMKSKNFDNDLDLHNLLFNLKEDNDLL